MTTQALALIERLCRERGAKLTSTRRRVMQIILASTAPMGAYDIMRALDDTSGRPQRTAPPTVYRALEFLQREGFVHRIASLQAFVPCVEPDHEHAGQFLVCADCGRVDELDDHGLERSLTVAAAARGFDLSHHIEMTGRCDECRSTRSEEDS
ncbi:MAG: Fur family transcriptional regulator [Pseudomonadota bacterium]